MITLEGDELVLRCPQVHLLAECRISFQRTLRIPDDGQDYPLPPGLGGFPLQHLDDCARRLPGQWLDRGGVLMPMHQAEAMWISFGGRYGRRYPFAIKVATGKLNAVTGNSWSTELSGTPQDYLCVPEQPWLDGYCIEKGTIRQFVAMPLGSGYSVEEQLTGKAEFGGIQILAYPMKADRFEELEARRPVADYFADFESSASATFQTLCDGVAEAADEFGLAPGGRMRQRIYEDDFGIDAWDQRHPSRCFVTILNSRQWQAVTGSAPPTLPPSAAVYNNAGFPWFEHYGPDNAALAGSQALAAAKSVHDLGQIKGETPLPENAGLIPQVTLGVGSTKPRPVREPVSAS